MQSCLILDELFGSTREGILQQKCAATLPSKCIFGIVFLIDRSSIIPVYTLSKALGSNLKLWFIWPLAKQRKGLWILAKSFVRCFRNV